MIRRLLLFFLFVMMLLLFSMRLIGEQIQGHLLLYQTLDTNELLVLDVNTLVESSFGLRLEYQNVLWSTVGERLYFSRIAEYPDAAVRFAFNLYGRDLIAADEQLLIDAHEITLPNGSRMGRWVASPDGSRIAYFNTIEGKSYFAVVGIEGESILDLHNIVTARPHSAIWSSDSQRVYLLNRSNRRITAYEYDFATGLLDGQIWVTTEERLVSMMPSPAGETLLFYENNSDAISLYDVSSGDVSALVTYDSNLRLEMFQSSLTWARDGSAFMLGFINERQSQLRLDVYAADGSSIAQETILLSNVSSTSLTIRLSSAPYVAAIGQVGQALCLYYFADNHLRCLPTSPFAYPIGFNP